MPMNDPAVPKEKKKLGCFASSSIFIGSFFSICLIWAILQVTFGFNYLPTQAGTIFRKWNSDPSFLAFVDCIGIILCIIFPTYLIFRKTINFIIRKNEGIEGSYKQRSKKWKVILFVLGEILIYLFCINYLFSSGWYDYCKHWMAIWVCICLGIFILFIAKYIINIIKKGILFYQKEQPEKTLACIIIALLLCSGWIIILNYGMCFISRDSRTFFYFLN